MILIIIIIIRPDYHYYSVVKVIINDKAVNEWRDEDQKVGVLKQLCPSLQLLLHSRSVLVSYISLQTVYVT
jgi:hypothetical protein